MRACEKTIAGLEGVGSKVKTFQLNSAKSEDTNAALTLLNRTQGCSLAENMSRVSELTSTTRVSERYRLSFACLFRSYLYIFALFCCYFDQIQREDADRFAGESRNAVALLFAFASLLLLLLLAYALDLAPLSLGRPQ